MKLEQQMRSVDAGSLVSPAGNRNALVATGGARTGAVEIAVFLLVVVAPLAMTPFTASPSVDPKLLFLAPAALIFALRRDTFRSTLAVPVVVWVAAVALAGIAGVDRWQSILGRESQGTGIAFLAVCGVALLAGTRLPESLRVRLPAWLVGAAVAAALIGIAARLSPGWFQAATGRPLGAHGGGLPPLGHAVFLGAFLSAGIAATVALARRRPVYATAAVAIMSAGIVLTGKRGPVVFALVALTVALVRARLPWRRAAALAAALVTVVGALTVFDVSSSNTSSAPLSAARRYDEVLSGSAAQRPAVWTAAARAWTQRPLTGWGPGNTGAATLSAATEAEARTMERIWQDAHNLAVESLVTTGATGLAALTAVFLVALIRLRRGTRSAGWALAAVAALGLHHAIQPMNLAVTPLFFFLLGVAGGDPGSRDAKPPSRTLRWAFVAVLALAIPLSMLRFGASAFESSGRRYFSAGHEALRTSLRLEPGRISTASYLAVQLAIDGKGTQDGARAARSAAAALVARHPWDPSVRLVAADVEIMLGDPARAIVWLDRQLARFPNDALALTFRGFASVRLGDPLGAEPYLEKARRLNPSGVATWTPGSSAG